jgi:DNA-binding CsgD family transcriptional regulator
LAEVRAAAIEGIRRARPDEPPDPALAWLAALALRAEADAASAARARRDEAALAESRAVAAAIVGRLREFEQRFAGGGPASGGRAKAIATLCRAELDRLEGGQDVELWARVVEGWEQLGRPFPAAYARLRVAEATLATRGSPSVAASALRSAHGTAVRLGAEPLRQQLELLARQARIEVEVGARVAQPATMNGDGAHGGGTGLGLTEREAEVLRLVAGGWSNQQIGDALYITRKTASVHVSNIMGKLGVASRVEAAALAHRLGLGADAPLPPGTGA